jgi:hypothetical protein
MTDQTFKTTSGRFNLIGQQKPDYLIHAITEEQKAWKEYDEAIDIYVESHGASEKIAADDLEYLYDVAFKRLQKARERWNEEQKQ